MKSITLIMMVLAPLVLGAGLGSSAQQEEPKYVDLLRLPGGSDGHGYGGKVGKKPPACCDDCFCIQPECRCMEYWKESCPDNCKNCVVLPPRLDPPFVQCDDVFRHSCAPLCTHRPR